VFVLQALVLSLAAAQHDPPKADSAVVVDADEVWVNDAVSFDGAVEYSLDQTSHGHVLRLWRPDSDVDSVAVDLTGANNPRARFVAGDNVLVTWGCGSPCELGAVVSPQGRSLAVLSFPLVSQSGAFAFDVDLVDLETGDADVGVVDLRTGKRVRAPLRVHDLGECTNTPVVDGVHVVYQDCPHGPVTLTWPIEEQALKPLPPPKSPTPPAPSAPNLDDEGPIGHAATSPSGLVRFAARPVAAGISLWSAPNTPSAAATFSGVPTAWVKLPAGSFVHHARFVVDDNVLVQYTGGDGTLRESAWLVTPPGRKLSTLGTVMLSPSGRFAFSLRAAPHQQTELRLVDLHDGRILRRRLVDVDVDVDDVFADEVGAWSSDRDFFRWPRVESSLARLQPPLAAPPGSEDFALPAPAEALAELTTTGVSRDGKARFVVDSEGVTVWHNGDSALVSEGPGKRARFVDGGNLVITDGDGRFSELVAPDGWSIGPVDAGLVSPDGRIALDLRDEDNAFGGDVDALCTPIIRRSMKTGRVLSKSVLKRNVSSCHVAVRDKRGITFGDCIDGGPVFVPF
jgi:hypothetical protein